MEPKIKIGKKEYSIKAVKHYSTFFLFCGILICLISIFIMPIGILFLVLGIYIVFVSFQYRNSVKAALTSPKQKDNGKSGVNESVLPSPKQDDISESSKNESLQKNYVNVCPNCGRKQYCQVKQCPDCGANLKNVLPIDKDNAAAIKAAMDKALHPGANFVLPDNVEAEIPSDETAKIALTSFNKSWLVCTDKEVFIFKRGFLTGHTFGEGVFREPYSNISGARIDFHLMSGYFEISASGTQSVPLDPWDDINAIEKSPNCILLNTTDEIKRNYKAACDYINKKIIEVHNPSQPQSSVATADPISKLDRLSELHDKGILTDEEFAVKKADLLKQI